MMGCDLHNREGNAAVRNESFATLFGFLALAGAALFFTPSGISVAGDAQVPVVDGHLGSCSVVFTVLDKDKKPVYDAKIDVVVRYGLMGLHKSELEVGTNSDGKAKVAGLPERSKKPLEFQVTHGTLSKTVQHDPSKKCEASIEVILGGE